MHFKEGYVCIELFQISMEAYIMLEGNIEQLRKIQGVSRAVKVEY